MLSVCVQWSEVSGLSATGGPRAVSRERATKSEVKGSYRRYRAEQVEVDRGTEKVEKVDFALECVIEQRRELRRVCLENRRSPLLQGDGNSGQGRECFLLF